MSKARTIFSLTLLFFILFSCCDITSIKSYAAEPEDFSFVRNRINSFKEFEAEEIVNYAQLQELLQNANEDLTVWQQKFQQLSLSERYSQASPIQRKRVKLRIRNLGKESNDLLDDLRQAKEDCTARLEILKSFTKAWSAPPKDAPEEIKKMHAEGLKDIRKLRDGSEKQLLKIDYLLKVAGRLQDRLDKLESGEKNNLFQLWMSWLVEGTDPVFSPDFWGKVLPGSTWMDLKSSELRIGLDHFRSRAVPFSFFVFGIFITSLFLIRLMDRSDYFQNRSEIERVRSLRLLAAVSLFFALYAAFKWIYPESMDSVAVVAFAAFYWAILKLSKLICRQKNKFVSGEVRSALLFMVSGILLALQVPGRSVVLVFLVMLLTFWGYASYDAWKRDRLNGVSLVAKRNSLLSPFFLVALFGYGRLACVLAILWSLGLFIHGFGSAWAQILFIRTEMSLQLKKGLVRSLAVPAGWAVGFGIAAFWLMDFFGASAITGLMNMSYSHGDYSIAIGSFVWLAVIFFMTRQSVSAFKVSIEYMGSNWPKAKKGAVPSIQTLFSYAVWFLFTLVALRVLGLSLTSITVIAGGLSVGIGFGLQNIVNNFIGGLILLFGRSIQQGDVIELNNLWCTVKKINIRTTQVETFENAVIMIPNSDLIASQVTNWTKNNAVIRRDIAVGVAYGSDIEKVRVVLLQLAKDHPHVLDYPEPYVHFNNFGNSSLDFILRVWIDDIDLTLITLTELRFAIDKAFREEKIEISFPQLDVHVKEALTVNSRQEDSA